MADYPEILQTLKDSVKQSLINNGINEETAEVIAFSSSETVREIFGGNQVYFCKLSRYKIHQRDTQILSEFTGNNYYELCIKYGVTKQWLYKIIKRQRENLRNNLAVDK